MKAAGALGYASGWVALYCGSCAVMVSHLALGERWTGARGYIFALLVGLGVYLLDRVKLTDRAFELGDAESVPGRYAFVQRHARALRVFAVVSLAGATAIGATAWWVLIPVPVIAAGVVTVYSGGLTPSRAGLKTVLVVKNLIVAVCLASLGVVAAMAESHRLSVPVAAWGVVLVRVFADSVACDIADAPHDRAHGTGTVPGRFGNAAGWGAVIACDVVACALGLGVHGTHGAALVWTVGALVTTPLIALAPTRFVRDLVDVRLTALAIGAMLAMG